MFDVSFSFNGVKRVREMPIVPTSGQIIDLSDVEDGRTVLRVDLVVFIEEGGIWQYHCNCTLRENWLG